jgi:phage-related minor tail protein
MAEFDPKDLTAADETAASLAKSLEALNTSSLAFGRSITGALKGAVEQGRSFDTVLRGIGLRLVDRALTNALAPLTKLIDTTASSALSGIGSALGFAKGGAFQGGRVVPFASGGVVASPSYFPLADGRTGLMGEAGPEAVMPLTRGPDGRLGVAAQGQAAVNVAVTINTPDVEGFRRSEAQLQTMLARAVGRGRRGL